MADRHDPRQRVLAAALTLATRHGPAGFSIVAVARAAGVSHTSIYNHFENRAQLLRTLADTWNMSVLEAGLAEARAIPAAGPVQRLRVLMRAMCRAKCDLRDNEPLLFAAYRVALDADPVARDTYLDRLESIVTDHIVAADPHAAGIAGAILSATAKFRHAAFIEKYSYETLVRHLDAVFDDLIAPRLSSPPATRIARA
jgi:AcrR family transcriptional regulator